MKKILVLIASFLFWCGDANACNSFPVATLSVNPSYVIRGRQVLLDGAGSYSAVGSIVKYAWDWTGDDICDYAETATVCTDGAFDGRVWHIFNTADTFNVKLWVTNSGGLSSFVIKTIIVSNDQDGDGLPDAWESQYNITDPEANADSDGYDNLCEYLHGSNPNINSSQPSAGTIDVPGDVTTIQDALDCSVAGDVIIVCPDTYNENIVFDVSQRTITSVAPDNWEITAKTVISADESSSPVVSFEGNASSSSILKGLTITGGMAGIYCDSVSPTISNCLVRSNGSLDGYGVVGGIYLESSSAVISNCFIVDNKAGTGGGMYNGDIYYLNPSPAVKNCVFYNNTANYYGGAIYNSDSSLTLRNCSIVRNEAKSGLGKGVYNFDSSSTHTISLDSAIVWGNIPTYTGNQIDNVNITPTIMNCDIQGSGNDPEFANIDNPAGKDNIFGTRDDGLRLRTDSPCIDAGTTSGAPAADIIGQGRVSNVDIGAYELNRIWFVKTDATTGDGSSWQNAGTLQNALLNAPAGSEIWVAAGTYKPTVGTDRNISFQLKPNVSVYGGFAGSETDFADRNLALNHTVLSGNIGVVGDATDNSYHVVKGANNALIDGFIVRDGYANGYNTTSCHGGGIFTTDVFMSVHNCLITNNYADLCGGGLFSQYGSIQIANCVFTKNTYGNGSYGCGGGIYTQYSKLVGIINCTIAANSPSPNSANCMGGGVSNILGHQIIQNTIIWGNTANINPNIYVASAVPMVFSSDIQGSGGSANWNSTFGLNGGGNIDSDPLFQNQDLSDPDGADNVYGTYDDGLRLSANSPCKNTADNVAAPAMDILGIRRDQAEMGAYEYPLDTDGDGLFDYEEDLLGTDPANPDTDDDGMPDGWEHIHGLDPLDRTDAPLDNVDNDGLTNLEEYWNNTNPQSADTDGDEMPDGWEVAHNLKPTENDAAVDADNDGLTNLQEYLHTTDPHLADTDGDGMPDGWEVAHNFNPNNASDGSVDGDNDGLTNVEEYASGTNPASADSDADGLDDEDEIAAGSNPWDKDSDNDGLSDSWEHTHGLNLLDASDAQADNDGDGLTNVEEFRAGTAINNRDTDGDGIWDGWEVSHHMDPLTDNSTDDPDDDGVNNAAEYAAGTHPYQHNQDCMIAEYEYDEKGHIQKQVIHDGQASTSMVTYATTEYSYDELGRQWRQRQYKHFGTENDPAEDQITLTAFDVQGNVRMTVRKADASTNPNGVENGDLVTLNKYYVVGTVWQTIQGTYSTTAMDNVALQKVTEYLYQNDQLYQVKSPKHGPQESDRAVTTFYYDAAGRSWKVVEATGHYRQMTYDSLGQVIKETAFKSDNTPVRQTRREYDDLGRLLRQAVMASAASTQAISTAVDTVTDYFYDYLATPTVRDFPGRLVAKTIYYTASGAPATTYFSYDELERELVVTDPDNNMRSVAYDTMGRIKQTAELSVNQVAGKPNVMLTTWNEYDTSGRLYRTITEKPDPQDEDTWRKTTYKYDAADRKRQETKPNGVATVMEYNGWGALATQIADAASGGLQQTTVYDYDRLGRQKTITGYTGVGMTGTAQTTAYTYNDLDKVTGILYPDSKTMAYAYFDNGMVYTRTDQRNLVTEYAYDATGRNLLTKTVTQNSITTVESFTYDALSRMYTAGKVEGVNPISALVFAYYDSGKLNSEQQTLFGGAARTVSYLYDPAGYRKQTTYPQGTQLNRTNDWQGRIHTLDIAGGDQIVDYAYVGSRVARRSYPLAGSGVNTDFSYDNLGRMTAIDAGAERAKFTYTYETNEDNIDKMYFHHRDPVVYNNFDYDNLDRVTNVTYLSNQNDAEVFPMDNLGNRTGNVTLRDGSTDTYAVNTTSNRYNSIDSANLGYDDAGNLTQDKDGYHYVYDYENRTTRIYKLSDQTEITVARFAYDALGRRIKKEDLLDSTKTRYYYYNDNWQILAEYNTTGTLKAYYIYGNYIDETLVLNDGQNDYYYLHDHLFSPAALLDDTGVVERYEYDAYGTVHFLSPNYEPRTTNLYANAYYFTGRQLDILDGGSLHHMHYRHRDYSPFMGRFFQQDPLQYIDGMNLYEYVKGNPITGLDAMGLWEADFHQIWTTRLSRRQYMWGWAATTTGYWDNYVDTWKNPVTQNTDVLGWHFSVPHNERHTWDWRDSRFVNAEMEFDEAVKICKESKEEIRIKSFISLEHLGKALHPVQDFIAHGTWYPFSTESHRIPWHPWPDSDNLLLDFAHSADGILRDWDDLGGVPSKPWFLGGTRRLERSINKTIDYLSRYKDAVAGTTCRCDIYYH